MLEGYTRPAMKQAISIHECKWIFSCSLFPQQGDWRYYCHYKSWAPGKRGFCKQIAALARWTKNTWNQKYRSEAYQLHGHTPIVGTAHDRSSTRSIQQKEHWNGIHNMKLSLKGTSSLGTNLGKGEEIAQITLRNIKRLKNLGWTGSRPKACWQTSWRIF